MTMSNAIEDIKDAKDVKDDAAKGAGLRRGKAASRRSGVKDGGKGVGRVAGRVLAFALRAVAAIVAFVCIEIVFANLATTIVYSLIERGSLAGLDGLNMFSAFCGAGSFAACAAAVGCWKGVGRLADRFGAKVAGTKE